MVTPSARISPGALAHLFIGVADMGPVRALWLDQFGLELVATRTGADAALARLWGLAPDAIVEQLLLRTPNTASGWLHFVEFAEPASPVRAGAEPVDLCPKNIDVNCSDIAARCAELAAAGATFRSPISAYTLDGLRAQEVQMPAHDGINVVLIEVEGWPLALSPRHYAAVTSFIATVADQGEEADFYATLFGFEQLMAHRITGAAIEQAVGLAPGAALEMQLLGSPEQLCGRVELITYAGTGTVACDLYPRARAPACGVLGARIEVADMPRLVGRAREAGVAVRDHGVLNLLFGRCHIVTVYSPAGLMLEVFQTHTASS